MIGIALRHKSAAFSRKQAQFHVLRWPEATFDRSTCQADLLTARASSLKMDLMITSVQGQARDDP
ncbi:MAG: hypothetical protein ACYDBJ_13135 [Aggregatilineales bacterium]